MSLKQILREALTSDRQLLMHITTDSSFSVVLSLMQQLADGTQGSLPFPPGSYRPRAAS